MYVYMYVCMYVCIHVCMYVCIHVCVYVRTYVCMYVCVYVCMYVYMYVCMYVRMYVCMCECMYVRTYVCMYVCMYTCMYVYMYVCMYVRTYVCMYVCTYVCMYVRTYVCMYVCMYAYMYTHMYVCMYICMYICMYVRTYVRMYVCTYVCMYESMYVRTYRLIKFIEKRNLIYDKQFGFRSHHSTEHAILSIVDKIQEAIEGGKFSYGIFLDFKKAFDTVNHEILITKLEHYGIRGIAKEWFTSYLFNRRQFTSIGNTNSEVTTISCGVPQGSVLGPLLFLIYINDFSSCSDILDLHLFADDSNLFFTHKNLSQLELIVNNELSYVHTWLCANKLSLNIVKSSFVLFHPPQRKIEASINLYINDTSLNEKDNIKYLGIIIDSNLNWKKQVKSISTKMKRNIGILSKLRYYVHLDILRSLYYSFIYPFLTYGLLVWGNTYLTNIKPLFILQKRAVRTMTFCKFDEHSSPLFKQTNILKLSDLIKFQISIFMYKFHKNQLPAVFDSYFLSISKVHNYSTRLSSTHAYALPKARTNYGKFRIKFIGAKVWNALDADLKTLSFRTFKARLKENFTLNY